MTDFFNAAWAWLSGPTAGRYGQSLLILVVGVILTRRLAGLAAALAKRHRGANAAMITRRLSAYALYTLVALATLQHMGFKLSVLLGAAGVLTVAVGFAAQTSTANLIAGLFLMGERPFVVGDVVEIGAVRGEVISIDLISVKLRTFDNLLVRVPNEMMVKAQITNYTHHPIRRLDLPFGVSHRADLPAVRRVLLAVADANPHAFDEPPPEVLFTGFGASSIDGQFRVWTLRSNVLSLRSELVVQIKQAFDEAGIEIPLPQQIVHYRGTPPGGSTTEL